MRGVRFLQKMQEKFIGRRKFSDIELEDDEKDPAAHNVVYTR